jgi:hypothetical protein
MVQVLERLTLKFQCLHDRDLPRVVLVARRSRNLNLLYSNHFPSSGIQRHINTTKIALPDKLSPDPLENGYEA